MPAICGVQVPRLPGFRSDLGSTVSKGALRAVASRWKPQPAAGGRRGAPVVLCAAAEGREVRGKPATAQDTRYPTRRSASPDNPDAVCYPASVEVDNTADPDRTVLVLEVGDFPGLLRSVAWLLNGLDMVVEEAHITTPEPGLSRDTFWLVTRRGCKLDDDHAQLLAERMEDFVMFCQPDESVMEADVFSSDEVTVNNYLDPTYTVVTVKCPTADKPGFMLELVTAMTALGLTIGEGFVKRDECEEEKQDDCLRVRTFKFLVRDHENCKLGYVLASGLIFTLSLLINSGERDLRGPVNVM